jgi:hypothetical protein
MSCCLLVGGHVLAFYLIRQETTNVTVYDTVAFCRQVMTSTKMQGDTGLHRQEVCLAIHSWGSTMLWMVGTCAHLSVAAANCTLQNQRHLLRLSMMQV